jgi:hypothetical protein
LKLLSTINKNKYTEKNYILFSFLYFIVLFSLYHYNIYNYIITSVFRYRNKTIPFQHFCYTSVYIQLPDVKTFYESMVAVVEEGGLGGCNEDAKT